jgi:hypothetical protein
MSFTFDYGDRIITTEDFDGIPAGTMGRILLCKSPRRSYVEFDIPVPNANQCNGLAMDGYGYMVYNEFLQPVEGEKCYMSRVLPYVNYEENGKITISKGDFAGLEVVDAPIKTGNMVFVEDGRRGGFGVVSDCGESNVKVVGLILNDGRYYFYARSLFSKNKVLNIKKTSENFSIISNIDSERVKEYIGYVEDNGWNELALDWYVDLICRCDMVFKPSITKFKCDGCGHDLAEDGSNAMLHDGKVYCRHCYDRMFAYCPRCDKRFPVTPENPEEKLCPNCRKREVILPYHHYQPPLKFYGDDKNGSVPFMGIELEVDNGGHSDENAKRLVRMVNKPNENFVYCSHDSSIHDGFEIITQPATYEYHSSIKNIYKEAFQMLKQNRYLSHDTETCGMHIHFNRTFFGENESKCLKRLYVMIDKFWKELVIFSRRNVYKMERYSKKTEIRDVDSVIRTVNRQGGTSTRDRYHEYHYYALNITNPNTIEIRMYRGTLNINTFIATIQLTNNMVIAAKNKTMQEVQQMKFDELLDGKILRKYWNRRKAIEDTEE